MPSLTMVGIRTRATRVRITHCRDNRKRYTPRPYLPVAGCRRAGGGSYLVDDARPALRAGAVRAAVPVPLGFDALADDLHTAVLAHGCHAVDRAREAVEDVHRALRVHLEGHSVVVATYFTGRHAPQGEPRAAVPASGRRASRAAITRPRAPRSRAAGRRPLRPPPVCRTAGP